MLKCHTGWAGRKDFLGSCQVRAKLPSGLFKLKPNPSGTWTESVLHNFTGADGQNPFAEVIFDAAGNLCGTTGYGGTSTACGAGGCGVVFKLKPNSDGTWTESVLHSFAGGDGSVPEAGLIFDAAGNL